MINSYLLPNQNDNLEIAGAREKEIYHVCLIHAYQNTGKYFEVFLKISDVHLELTSLTH